MKLNEIKILKENKIYKRIIEELKIKGLDNIYIKKTDSIDYLDIIINIITFLENNKNIIKKLNKNAYSNLIIIIIDEIMDIDLHEEQIEKILILLKNSLLVQTLSSYLFNLFNKFIYKCKCRKVDIIENK
jgi:hypothetical protein